VQIAIAMDGGPRAGGCARYVRCAGFAFRAGPVRTIRGPGCGLGHRLPVRRQSPVPVVCRPSPGWQGRTRLTCGLPHARERCASATETLALVLISISADEAKAEARGKFGEREREGKGDRGATELVPRV
jgi:hypothetical protein